MQAVGKVQLRDFIIRRHGNVACVKPLTSKARIWLREHFHAPLRRWSDGTVTLAVHQLKALEEL